MFKRSNNKKILFNYLFNPDCINQFMDFFCSDYFVHLAKEDKLEITQKDLMEKTKRKIIINF